MMLDHPMRGPEPPRGRMGPGPGPFPEPMDMRGPPPPDMMRRGPPPPEAMRRGPPPMENGRGSGPLPGPYGPGPGPASGGGGGGSRRGRGGGGGAPGPAAQQQQQQQAQQAPRTPSKMRGLKVVELSPSKLADLAKNSSDSCFYYEDPQVRLTRNDAELAAAVGTVFSLRCCVASAQPGKHHSPECCSAVA